MQTYTPQHVVIDATDATAAVLSLAFGDRAAVALTAAGGVFAWGSDVHGVTGQRDGGDAAEEAEHEDGEDTAVGGDADDTEYYLRPCRVPAFVTAAVRVSQIACGPQHVLARTAHADTPVWSWGCGYGHRLGHGDDRDRARPTPVTALSGLPVHHVAAAGTASFALVDRRAIMALLGALGHALPRPITPAVDGGVGSGKEAAVAAGPAPASTDGGGARRTASARTGRVRFAMHDDDDDDVRPSEGAPDDEAPAGAAPGAVGYTGRSLVVWGTGLQGQLGLGTTCLQVPLPTAVPAFEMAQTNITFVVRGIRVVRLLGA